MVLFPALRKDRQHSPHQGGQPTPFALAPRQGGEHRLRRRWRRTSWSIQNWLWAMQADNEEGN